MQVKSGKEFKSQIFRLAEFEGVLPQIKVYLVKLHPTKLHQITLVYMQPFGLAEFERFLKTNKSLPGKTS
jgi:hypothetical protein